MKWPSSPRVLGCCGLAASLSMVGGYLVPAGLVMAAANVYALVRG